jgi:hypothetical protein
MRRPHPLWLLLPVLAAAWAAWPRLAARPAAPPPVPGGGAAFPWQAQGVASCASMACHHFNGPKGSKGSEYTTWVSCDPHARAYTTLFEERSRLILRNLRQLAEVALAHPERDPLCLSCHVYPDPDLAGAPCHPRFTAADGVGCEACHGPAQGWLAAHYRHDWKALSPAQRSALGFVDTKDLRVRAEVCAGCHVGRREMDVNHDLIAAGHPRLRFEYGAYLANYHSRHWKLADEKRRHPDHEARAWAVGQLVSAKSALELLAQRAEGAARKPWPEFAEYNCAACHHRLEGGAAKARPGKGKLGELPWGTWYYPLLPALATPAERPGLTAALDRLDGLMRKRVPPEKVVAGEARRAVQQLGRWAAAVNDAPVDSKALQALFAALAQDRPGRGSGPLTWDEATQQYLALAALHHGLADLKAPRRPGLAEAVKALGLGLQKAFPEGQENTYDTPSRFDPAAIDRALGRIRELLK